MNTQIVNMIDATIIISNTNSNIIAMHNGMKKYTVHDTHETMTHVSHMVLIPVQYIGHVTFT